MTLREFRLAATTNDLTREPKARGAADVIEFRMDSAEDPVAQLSEYDGDLPVIATNRTKWSGGQADDTGRLDQLFAATRFDVVEMVDIEAETARGKQWVLNEFRDNDVEIIVSCHVFEKTPDRKTLGAIIEECADFGDIAKVAALARTKDDSLKMLEAINTATEEGMCVAGLSMGEVGRITRIISSLYGSRLGYAPLESDTNDYAPGQIPLYELRSYIEMLKSSGDGLHQINNREENTPKSISEQTN